MGKNGELNFFDFKVLDKFRQAEVQVFYANIASLFAYVLMSKIFIGLKRYSEKLEDLKKTTDPFMMLLLRDENDFFAKDNYFMIISTLKLTSTFFTVLVAAKFTKNDYEDFTSNEQTGEEQKFIDTNTESEQTLLITYLAFVPID